jgi:hypothetical protein
MAFSSSRTFPGHGWRSRSSRDSALRPRTGFDLLLREELEEVLCEEERVLAPLAERRQRDRHHVETVEEILAESPSLDLGLEIAIGRGDQAEVHAAGHGVPDAADLRVLKHAEQLHLERGGHLPHLVQEQRAAVGRFEETDAVLRGAR